MARCARSCCRRTDTDLGHHIPYKRVSFGLDAIEVSAAPAAAASPAMLSIKEYPDAKRVPA